MKYVPTIGLEIHAELKTQSKMFCPCRNDPDEEKPNVNVCPICLGHPGTLPVLNQSAIRHVLKIGVATDGTLADFTEWDRKNYFYPDIPKGYQISQYKFPLVYGGVLAGIPIERIHLEEDTAQSTHDTHEKSLINFNRSGVPLMELVTKPAIHDGATALRFARELQLLLRYIAASEANLEKGEMRIEANISIASQAETTAGRFGVKTEVKNLNSFRSVEKAIDYEVGRQTALLEGGGLVLQETRGFDENSGETFSQRSKESSHDYRYFPEPDIPKLKLSEIAEFSLEPLKAGLPELPRQKRERYKKDHGMTDKEVAVFVDSPDIATYFEAVISAFPSDSSRIRLSINYILSDYLGLLKKESGGIKEDIEIIPAKSFSDLVAMIAAGDISSRGAKEIIPQLIKEPNKSPITIAEQLGLMQKSNVADIEPIIERIIAQNTSVVEEYRAGKVASLQFLIGQAMKMTKGAANPAVVKELLLEKLS